MSDSTLPAFSFGFLLCAVVLAVVVNLPQSIVSKARDAIDACEKDLPRNQHCVVSAVVAPVEGNK